jgi:hypothetical protein
VGGLPKLLPELPFFEQLLFDVKIKNKKLAPATAKKMGAVAFLLNNICPNIIFM